MTTKKKSKIDTFEDLYKFLQTCEDSNIINFLNDISGQESGYNQEALTKLLGGLNLIDKLKNWFPCIGNFNKQTIQKQENYNDIFYKENGTQRMLKGNGGDSSDFTLVSNFNDKELLIMSSKSLNNENIGKLDIEKMLFHAQKYIEDGYKITYGFIVKDKKLTDEMISRTKTSSKTLADLYNNENTIVIDWQDLNQAYHMFKLCFINKNISDIINSNKKPLCLKLHQNLSVIKTLKMKDEENKTKILWGHIQRSGKSYIIAGCIIQDSINKNECTYLVITTAPNETIEQQRKVFDCQQLEDFDVTILNDKNKNIKNKNKNIIICSKQFLQSKIEEKKSIKWLKKINFDMRFIDESHNGGTTELAQKTLDYYGKNSFTVQITATYSKPINDYNISKDSWILWDLEDIKLCKNITNENSIDRLVEKHGEEFKKIYNNYSLDNIIIEYSKYPDLWLLTDEIKPDTLVEIIKDTKDNNYGWSSEACFLLKQCIKENNIIMLEEFQNETETLKMWYRIFGKRNKFGIPDKDYSDDIVFMKRIEKICKNPEINSRFIDDNIQEPMIIMAFLPQNNIDIISNATIKLLQKNNVIPNYEIISINSKITNNPKKLIEDTRIIAKNKGKIGVLVLSGRQCSLGVSIDNCDIVLLLNNNSSFDMIYQMMFRCMTESVFVTDSVLVTEFKTKKCGFVVDLNIHRVIETSIINYASLIKPDIHPKEAIKYILQERLINLNGDHWVPSFGNNLNKINSLCENVYEIYSSNTENALNHFLNRLSFKKLLLSKEEQIIFTTMFNNITPTKEQKEFIDKLINDDDSKKINTGIEKTKITIEKEEIKEEKPFDYINILKHIIPLICLLTIHDKETSFVEMFHFIENNKYIYDILVDQTRSWWGKNIDSKIIKKFINVYIKYMKNDKETNQIIRTVKELFTKNINNSKQLSQLIDKYLIPQELEKKSNAEVSTQYKLRQEMLDLIPVEEWQTLKKVFEPCAGKGGFIVDIIDRFMNGLKDLIPDEKLRYKTIVEECLYFSDINPTNIFICKLLIDPYNEYKLNYYEGNTLELNIKEQWNINYFYVIVGNPPYQKNFDNNNGRVGGSSLWSEFINYSMNILEENGFLLFITPCSWMTGGSNKQSGNILKGVMQKYTLLHLNIEECSKYFNVASTFSYYLIKKSVENINFNCICNYKKKIYTSVISNNTFRKLSVIPKLFTNEMISIINKIENANNNKFNFQRLYDLDIRQTKRYNKTGKYNVRHKVVDIRQTDWIQECMNKDKIVISMPGYIKVLYDKECGCSDATLFMYVKNEDEGKKLINLLNSNIYQIIINNYRELTGLNNHKNINRLSIVDIKDIKFTDKEQNIIDTLS
jgi:hypothetical protein